MSWLNRRRRKDQNTALAEHLKHRRQDPEYDRLVQRVFDLDSANYSVREIAELVDLSSKGVRRILHWKDQY